jgi:hypothetical protein
MTKNCLSMCSMALNSGKRRRGILNIGETDLKWLFGVSAACSGFSGVK